MPPEVGLHYDAPAMTHVFLISIQRPYAEAIARGEKLWEFRRNPAFGQREGLKVGDVLFIVAMDDAPELIAHALVTEIVRDEAFVGRFEEPDVADFKVALCLAATPLTTRLRCDRITRRGASKGWGGKGFMAASDLHRYELEGEPVEEALRAMVPELDPMPPTSTMRQIRVQIHGDLRVFVTSERARRSGIPDPVIKAVDIGATPSVKDLIEAVGIPHPEIDAVVVDGVGMSFEDTFEGREVSVFPFGLGPEDAPRLIPTRSGPLSFVVDVHLSALARHMRLLGLDTADPEHIDDARIAAQSAREGRILLTRDIGLLKRSAVTEGLWIRSRHPEDQARQLVIRYALAGTLTPMTRCLMCNEALLVIPRDKVLDELPEQVRDLDSPFFQCQGCQKIYWHGTHYEALLERLVRLQQ